MAKRFPKIALGGSVGRLYGKDAKINWVQQCFARVWPKRIHGLGFADRDVLEAVPFHSADASSWQAGATRFGNWASLPGVPVKWRGSNHNLRTELEMYLRLERDLRSRWGPTLAAIP